MQPPAQVETFLKKLYTEEDSDDALDLVFELVDDLLDGYSFQSMDQFMGKLGAPPVFNHEAKNPDFEALDAVIHDVDLTKVNSTVALGFLASSYSAREYLKEWQPYLARLRKHFTKTQSKKKAKALLQHFGR